MNSAMFYGRASPQTGNDSSESDISSDSSDEYEPSSSETDEAGSSYPDSASESDEETNDNGAPPPSASSVPVNWGLCTLQIPRFGFTGSADPQINITESDPLKIYRHFLTDEILQLIVTETNRYAQQFIASHQLRRPSLMQKWKDTTVQEMLTFFAVLAIMGINSLLQLHLYWSKKKMQELANCGTNDQRKV